MKKLLFYLTIVLAVAFLFVTCATEKEVSVPTECKELYGVWINPAYQNNSSYNEKMVFYQNGVLLEYIRASNEQPYLIIAYNAVDKWSDEQGNTYFKLNAKAQTGGVIYVLIRLFDSGKSLELSLGVMAPPEEIDRTNEGRYRGIYTKQ